MAQSHLEIERKFDVGEDFVLPDLSAVPGVAGVTGPEERQLEAVYHDTADLRLARAKVTLRRRTGGPDAGWHVKLPAGTARRELHSPLGRAGRTVPKAVQAPVEGIVRGARLLPVATLRTRRVATLLSGDDGRVLAEVADDSVTATTPSAAPGEPATVLVWREVEVELVDGDDALLAAVAEGLQAAGARPSASASKLSRALAPRLSALDGAVVPTEIRKPEKATAGQVVRAALAAQARALQDADLMVRTDDPEGVHDLRVACRRLRSILAAYRPVLTREHTDELREELRWLGQEFSGARDAEVALEHLRGLVAAQPVELVLGPVAARLQQEEIKDHAEGTASSLRTLRSARYLALRDRLDALVAEPPFTPEADRKAAPVLRAVLARTTRRLRHDVRAARAAEAQAQRDHLLHEARKAAKRVRYTAEVAAPVLGTAVGELIGSMKDLQDLLGERQDTVVTREECRRLGLAAFAAGENPWTYGRLEALEEARADRAEREFWERWPEFRAALKRATTR